MAVLKPFQLVASQFGISEESAKYFLGQVQKSFKKQKPPHDLILRSMEKLTGDYLPAPYDIALIMHESGTWEHPLNAPPPELVDGSDDETTTSLIDGWNDQV